MKKQDIPLVKGFLTDDEKQIEVWCPFCQTYHVHGVDEEFRRGAKLHRIEHCSNRKSPFCETGYYVQIEEKVSKVKR